MERSRRSPVVASGVFGSRKAVSILQSKERRGEPDFFLFFFNLLFCEQRFPISQSGGVSLKHPLWQGCEERWLGKEGQAAPPWLADRSCNRAAASLHAFAGGRTGREPQSHCPALALGCRQCHGCLGTTATACPRWLSTALGCLGANWLL